MCVILYEAQMAVTALIYYSFMLITSYLATCCKTILWPLVLKMLQFALLVVIFILKPNKLCIYVEYYSWRYMFEKKNIYIDRQLSLLPTMKQTGEI